MIRREQPAQLAQVLAGLLGAVKQNQQRNEFQGAMQGADLTGNEDARMRVLAQMLGLGNPYANQYIQGQKAIQSLGPEYDVIGGAESGYYRVNKKDPASSIQNIIPGRGPKPEQSSDKERGIGHWVDEKGNYVYGPYRPGLKPWKEPEAGKDNTSAIELRIRTLEDDIEKAEQQAQEAELKMSALESGVDPILKYDRDNPQKSSGYQMYNVLGTNRLALLKRIEQKRKELERLQAGSGLKRPIGSANKSQPTMEYDYVPGKGLVPRGR